MKISARVIGIDSPPLFAKQSLVGQISYRAYLGNFFSKLSRIVSFLSTSKPWRRWRVGQEAGCDQDRILRLVVLGVIRGKYLVYRGCFRTPVVRKTQLFGSSAMKR